MRLKKHVAVHAGNDTKPLECTDCGKRFLTNSALAGHIKMHVLPDALYDCPICSQESEQVSSLKDHVYEHRENGIFTCPPCEKTFKEYPSIRKHIKVFHSEKRFACTICEKSFSGKDRLKIHIVRHSEVKDFMCDDCQQIFDSLDQLSQHCRKIHGNLECIASEELVLLMNGATVFCLYSIEDDPKFEKRFQCNQCLKTFTTKVQLKHHMNIHLGLRPYTCLECGKGFTQPTHLKVHQRTHDVSPLHMLSMWIDVCNCQQHEKTPSNS